MNAKQISGSSAGGDDPIHSPVTVTILDTVTGETRTDSEWSPWYWAYGNGSCDCNRGFLFGNEHECEQRRYYIVDVEGDDSGYAIGEDYNHGYPPAHGEATG
jgi:hypothetical protein